MLDSGAFSVWNRGHKINLDEYIAFCKQYPDISYYVNLDVIPGRARNKASIGTASVKKACREGWSNFERMIEVLPFDRVMPVFHQNDDFSYLEKMLDMGCGYIGISPANDESTKSRAHWIKCCARELCYDGSRMLVKVHGFAVTSYRLMDMVSSIGWHWHSVDSASWKIQAAWGYIYIPVRNGNRWDYSKEPRNFLVSPATDKKRHGMNAKPLLNHCDSAFPQHVKDYIENECGMELGESERVTVKRNYKVDLEAGETWYSKARNIIHRPVIKGVSNSFEHRVIINHRFMVRVNRALPVDHIYLAGAPMPYPCEWKIKTRLLSYEQVGRNPKPLEKHLALLRDEENKCASTE